MIEALAKMKWCNGSVGLAGNSHLAIAQWFIASLKPPSLKAIAPWEGTRSYAEVQTQSDVQSGCGDLYREQFARGGVFNMSNFGLIAKEITQGSGVCIIVRNQDE